MPVEAAGNGEIGREISRRWKRQLVLDRAVAAIRSGNSDEAIALAESVARENPSATVGLLAAMIRDGHPALIQYAYERVRFDPSLINQRFNGRTLLHIASGAGVAPIVQLLLRLGCDANVTDSGRHTALYHLANECRSREAVLIAAALIQSGADVNACGGVKRCTPLHMAARRGNVEIAKALLAAGADIHATDKAGDTPLGRARNCRKAAVVALLLARGADAAAR